MARVAEKEDGGPLFTAADRTRLTYTSCYCEENAYKLVEAALAMQAADGGAPPAASEGVDHEDSAAAAETLEERSDGGRKLFVLFISSRGRAVPIWCQKAAAGPAEPVVWDYHVVVLDDGGGAAPTYVYDFDTTLPFATELDTYLRFAFPAEVQPQLEAAYRPLFRVVPARDMLDYFASDRSHMRKAGGGWQAAPPPYACLKGPRAPKPMMLHAFLDLRLKPGGFDFLAPPRTLPQLRGAFGLSKVQLPLGARTVDDVHDGGGGGGGGGER